MSTPALFSVILPSYNRAYILPEAIESVLAQGQNIEIIVIDDGSKDNTASVAARYGEVKYIYQENQGISAARITGLQAATGNFICFLDSDDLWLPEKLRTELELFERFPEAGAIASDAESYQEGRLISPSWMQLKGVNISGPEPFFLSMDAGDWLKGSLFATCCITLRRSCLARLGHPPFDPSLRSFSDWELEVRLVHYSRILVLPRVLAIVRRFNDGTRGDRATPGTPPTREQERVVLQRRHRVVGNALSLKNWPAEIRSKLETQHGELTRDLAAHGS